MSALQRVAVVTGANKGLGFETAKRLGRNGYNIVLTARNRNRGQEAVNQLKNDGVEAEFALLDVTKDADIQNLVSQIRSKFGHLDVLVNNAGIFIEGGGAFNPSSTSIFKVPPVTVLEIFKTNTLGPLKLCQLLIPLMHGREGRIVNVSSGMGSINDMGGSWPGYRISKASLNVITRILASELRDSKIKVNSVCPGWVRTSMGGSSADRSVEEGAETIVWAATLPEDGPTGGFFRDKQPIEW